jgi:hypothetical protein
MGAAFNPGPLVTLVGQLAQCLPTACQIAKTAVFL